MSISTCQKVSSSSLETQNDDNYSKQLEVRIDIFLKSTIEQKIKREEAFIKNIPFDCKTKAFTQ